MEKESISLMNLVNSCRTKECRENLMHRHAPHQNGIAKRQNRHIVEVAYVLMNEKNVPNYYWSKAIVVYIMNRTPTIAMHEVTPEEKHTKMKPNLSHLKVFGCIFQMKRRLS